MDWLDVAIVLGIVIAFGSVVLFYAAARLRRAADERFAELPVDQRIERLIFREPTHHWPPQRDESVGRDQVTPFERRKGWN